MADLGRRRQTGYGEDLRPNAHCYETGGMRRTHLRGHANIRKRLLIHHAGFNLGLLMRQRFGFGKPRALQGLRGLLAGFFGFLRAIFTAFGLSQRRSSPSVPVYRPHSVSTVIAI